MLVSLKSRCLVAPIPLYLGGYSERKEPARTVHDDLYVRALFISSNKQNLAILSYDLLNFDNYYTKRFKEDILKRLDIPNLNILMHCVHTHASSSFSRGSTGFESPYQEDFYHEIVNKSVEAIIDGYQDLRDCSVAFNSKFVEGVGANRRDKKEVKPTILRNIVFKDKATGELITVVNFNCHPTVMSALNLEISKDYQGACIDILQNEYQRNSLFLQGACGDISTRFTRKEQSFAEVERLGRLLANYVIENTKELEFYECDEFRFDSFYANVEVKKFKDIEYYDRIIATKTKELKENSNIDVAELRIYQTALQGAHVERILAENIDKIDTEIEIKIVTFLNFAIVFMAIEYFSILQEEIVKASPFENTAVVCYTDGYVGYIPDIESAKHGGYEVLSSRYQPGTGEQIAKQIIAKLHEIKKVGKV